MLILLSLNQKLVAVNSMLGETVLGEDPLYIVVVVGLRDKFNLTGKCKFKNAFWPAKGGGRSMARGTITYEK